MVAICCKNGLVSFVFLLFTEEYKSHFYHVRTEEENYCNAEKYCADHGARLVARNLATARQFSALQGLSTERVWIGVTDLLHERGSNKSEWQLSWGSNRDIAAADSQFIEANWGNNQPNNLGEEGEQCVFQENSLFYDNRCSNTYKFVCEFDSRYAADAANKQPAKTSDDASVCTNVVDSIDSVAQCIETFVSF